MKCPKCGYLGFETSDRCRNCGYDFSLSQQVTPTPELPLQQANGGSAPLADLDMRRTPAPDTPSTLDLDRLIGGQTVVDASRARAVESPPAAVGARSKRDGNGHGNGNGAGNGHRAVQDAAETGERSGLPLFTPDRPDPNDNAPVATPRRAGAPLSVRRSTPDVPRGRSLRPPRPAPRPDATDLALQLEVSGERARHVVAPPARVVTPAAEAFRPAGLVARVTAAFIDLMLLGAVDAAVLYFTLA